ncbi:hypothetical protein QJS66_18120 [Kocuria rhizophila]|nr:hypothetical protein QJS66_18120 [Kocuria rhizophila]
MAELVAITGYVQFWWPAVPLWLPTGGGAGNVFLLNAMSMKAAGEMRLRSRSSRSWPSWR